MSVMQPRILTFKELSGFDELHSKANSALNEARTRLDSYDWDLAVRRSQEAVELHTKALFRFIGKDYPKTHDLEKVIYEISTLLEGYGVGRNEVARTVLATTTLGTWRLPSLYGDEHLGVVKLFRQKEADMAVSLAEEVRMVCERVRSDLYRRASKS